MSLKFRRLIYLSFIGVFLVSAAFLVPYSAGYRYDAKSGRIVKTGSLVIDSRPKNALIRLEGKEQKIYFFQQLSRSIKKVIISRELKEKTPVIFNLKPSEYLVEVSKEGYHPWRKNLEVYSKQATFADKILLFLQKPVLSQAVEGKIILSTLSPDKSRIAYVALSGEKTEIMVFDLEMEESFPVFSSASEIKTIKWSPSSKKLLVSEGDEEGRRLIINIENPDDVLPLEAQEPEKSTVSPSVLKDIRWDVESDNVLYGRLADTVYRVDLFLKSAEKVLESDSPEESLVDYLITNGSAYYISSSEEGFYLKKKKLGGSGGSGGMEIPPSPGYSFIWEKGPREGLLAIRSRRNDGFFLVDFGLAEFEKAALVRSEANDIEWSGDGKKLLYYNDFEIWIFYLEDAKSEMLGRYSTSLREVQWHPGEDYVIFAAENSIMAVEEDGRGQRNSVQIIDAERADDIALYGSTPGLYVFGRIDGKEGLHKIKIQ